MTVFYREIGLLNKIEKIILLLDFDKIDFSSIIALCIQMNLFKPLIVISTTYNNDYFTPLARMVGSYQINLDNDLGYMYE